MTRNSRKRRPKAHAQQTHAIRRALERFDVELSAADLAELVHKIQHNGARHLDDTSNRVGRFLIYLPGEVPAIACYDRRRQQITTFLPPAWVPGATEDER